MPEPTQPTAQQLQAQADAARAREQAEAQRRADEASRDSGGILNFLRGLIPDFSFFNILLFVGIACGAYFLGRTEGGQRLLGSLFGEENVRSFFNRGDSALASAASAVGINIDISAALEAMPIEQVRTTLAERGVAQPIVNVLARTPETFHQFLTTVKTANGGHIGINDLTPAALIAGPSLDALLSPANRATTVALMLAAAPANSGITAATLNALIAHGMGADGKPTPSLRRLLTAATDGSLQTLQASLSDARGRFSAVKAVDVLLNAESRALIRSIGTDNIAIVARERSPELNQRTLDAALAFGDAIDGNAANNGANRPRTLAVMHALAAVATGTAPATAFRGITAAQLSGFFAVPGNQTAVGNLLRVVQPSIARHWGNNDHGLAEVLASAPDADKILRFMRGDIGWLENAGSTVADWFGVSMTTKLSWAGGKLAENAADVAAVLTPPPATPRAPQQRG